MSPFLLDILPPMGEGTITCSACGKKYAAKSELAGKRAKCKCGSRIEFPAEKAAEADLRGALDSSITRTMIQVRNDRGPFTTVAGQFTVNKGAWFGTVLASPVAFYFIKGFRNRNTGGVAAAAAAGGLIGGLVAGAIAGAMQSPETLSTCKAEDLPQEIYDALDPKGKFGNADVIIVPRSTISLVAFKGLGGTITIHAGADRFITSAGMFKKNTTKASLTEMGWEFNTQLTPTDAPVHDTRPEDKRRPTGLQSALKIFFIIILSIIILGLLAFAIFINVHG